MYKIICFNKHWLTYSPIPFPVVFVLYTRNNSWQYLQPVYRK